MIAYIITDFCVRVVSNVGMRDAVSNEADRPVNFCKAIFFDTGMRCEAKPESSLEGVLFAHRKARFRLQRSRSPGIEENQAGMMASVGHTATHEPQSVHLSGSIQRRPFFSLIASTGHSDSHAPQLTHASVIL